MRCPTALPTLYFLSSLPSSLPILSLSLLFLPSSSSMSSSIAFLSHVDRTDVHWTAAAAAAAAVNLTEQWPATVRHFVQPLGSSVWYELDERNGLSSPFSKRDIAEVTYMKQKRATTVRHFKIRLCSTTSAEIDYETRQRSSSAISEIGFVLKINRSLIEQRWTVIIRHFVLYRPTKFERDSIVDINQQHFANT